MLPTYVALVPFDDNSQVDEDELLHVATALQTQVVRDLSPIWGVSAVVSPFQRLEQVPAGYFLLSIVGEQLPDDARGFHLAPGGIPFALIKRQSGWPFVASHELIELVCDPYGYRTVTAPSLEEKQGLVDYLLEVCDPCESSGYNINGVPVSDFVTPEYYETSDTPGTRYTFLEAINRPLGLLANGYISWQTPLPNRAIWQATTDSDNGDPQTRLVPDTPSRFSREWIDSQTLRHPAIVGARSQWRYSGADKSSTDWARAFRRDTNELLRWLNRSRKHPPNIDEIISVLNDVVKDWDSFNDDKDKLKRKLRGELGITTQRAPQLAAKKDYEDVIKALKQQQKVSGLFGSDTFSPDTALWLCMLIG